MSRRSPRKRVECRGTLMLRATAVRRLQQQVDVDTEAQAYPTGQVLFALIHRIDRRVFVPQVHPGRHGLVRPMERRPRHRRFAAGGQ